MGELRFGVGARGMGGTRIQVMKNQSTIESVYPSIFNISSGESSMLCMFGELIRQADNNLNNIQLNAMSGIVIIDEVDKHLHIKLQKEVLPLLFSIFPNVQFIVSSHSPFLSMGLAEVAPDRAKIIDLETFGISKDPTTNELYAEVYQMMIGENESFKVLYRSLEEKIKVGMFPLIITEGKTDLQHIKKAKEQLGITDLEIDYFEIPAAGWGSSQLRTLLENICRLPNIRKVIGIFDRDEPLILNSIEANGQPFKKYGNNVFAFCIPAPVGKEHYSNISIEFYYDDKDLKKESVGKCLYFDNEVNFDKKRGVTSRIDHPADDAGKKIQDENIGALNWIYSKARFADLVTADSEFITDFNFNNFNLIFEKIRLIDTFQEN